MLTERSGLLLASKLPDEIGLRRENRRRKAGNEYGRAGHDHREEEHPAINSEVKREGDRRREVDRADERRHPPRQQNGGPRPEERQNSCFRDELANEPAAPRPNREAHPYLALAPRRSGQQHAGNVEAGDEQDEPDDHHEPARDRQNLRVGRWVEVHLARGPDRHLTLPVRRGILGGKPRPHEARFARALSAVRPSFSRPRMKSQRSPRRSSRLLPVGDGSTSCIPTGSTSSDEDTGIQISGESTGTMPVNQRGVTPTMANGVPRILSVLPVRSAAEPSSRTQ